MYTIQVATGCNMETAKQTVSTKTLAKKDPYVVVIEIKHLSYPEINIVNRHLHQRLINATTNVQVQVSSIIVTSSSLGFKKPSCFCTYWHRQHISEGSRCSARQEARNSSRGALHSSYQESILSSLPESLAMSLQSQ